MARAFVGLGRYGATFALFGVVDIFGASATTPLRLSSPETAGRMPGVQTDSLGLRMNPPEVNIGRREPWAEKVLQFACSSGLYRR